MPENQNIEWKESWRSEYLKWICGFANAQGGELVIGKNNRGEVVGIDNARKLLEDIPNQVRDLMGILVDIDLHQLDDLDYLEIKVEPYPYPVSLKGAYHYRSGSTKQEMKGAALDRFLLRKQGKHWDGVPVPHVEVTDLDEKALRWFRSLALNSKRLSKAILDENDSVLIEKLHLTDGDYLKRAAILLFHPDPEKYVTGAYVKIGFFRTDSDLLYHDEVHGDLFAQVNRTIDLLLTKYFRAMISYEGLQRIETWPIPEAALREAVLNAIIHKDYAAGTPIQISVYEDRLMIWDSGRLPENWTIENLMQKHSSEPYNPDIANAFFRAGSVETWGRGIERIMDSCREVGLPAPEFKYEHTGLWVIFSFFGQCDESSEKTSEKTSEKILRAIEKNRDITIAELAEIARVSTRSIERNIKKLQERGELKRIGADKGGHWEMSK